MKENKIVVKLIKSPHHALVKQKRTIKALGLTKINSCKVHNDNEAIRGMIFLVKHMVNVSSISY